MNEFAIRQMLEHETPIRAAEAARRCGVDVNSLVRWITRGKTRRGLPHLKLDAYPAGRSWMTTVEALARFLAASSRLHRAATPLIDLATARRDLEAYERSKRERLERAPIRTARSAAPA